MVKEYYDTPTCSLFEIITNEVILKLVVESLEKRNGEYYTLIKEYIMNYEKNDKKIKLKIRKIMFFIQDYIKEIGEKKLLNKIKLSMHKLGINNNKSLYFKLCIACIKYSETKIIKEIISF